MFDHCFAEIPDDDRCHMIEANIQETLLELNIREDDLDKLWREYAECGEYSFSNITLDNNEKVLFPWNAEVRKLCVSLAELDSVG